MSEKLTSIDVEISMSSPAILSNKFFITITASVRIAFCEQLGDVIRPRTAVCMSRDDAHSLCILLAELLGTDVKKN